MKDFKTFLFEKTGGTYISAKVDKNSSLELKKFAKNLGLSPLEHMHATLVFSEPKLDIEFGEEDIDINAEVVGIKYLGDKDSEYRAIVLELNSPELESLHQKYIDEYGYTHPHDKFIQHVSLAYKPPEDIDLNGVELPNFKIKFNKIKIEELDT